MHLRRFNSSNYWDCITVGEEHEKCHQIFERLQDGIYRLILLLFLIPSKLMEIHK